jgi:putative transposase
VVCRHHRHPAGERFRVSGGGDGLIQPTGSGLAFVDWHGHGFCVEALQDALDRHGSADFNSDRGVQVASAAFTGVLAASGVRISMDGKGRTSRPFSFERLRRSLKYEEIYIKAYASVPEARRGIGDWLSVYSNERLPQALGYRSPCEVFQARVSCGYVDNASALPKYPQAHHQQQERDSIEIGKGSRASLRPSAGRGS